MSRPSRRAGHAARRGPIPANDPQVWRLKVGGLVARPLELSLADLKSRYQARTLTVTLQMRRNRRAGLIEVRDMPGEDPRGPGATSTAEWTGVSLAPVLEAAGVLPGASRVAFAAPDVSQIADPPQSFGGSIGLHKALAGEVMLAWG